MKSPIHYINTDLELVAVVDLTPLADALASKGLFQLNLLRHEALWHASFETGESFDSPELTIVTLLTVVESLDVLCQNLWFACMSRTFDIGFECGDEPFSFLSHVTAPTLARMVAAGASLHLTLYAPSDVQLHHHDAGTQIA